MIPDSIKRRREKTFSECRKLLSKINGKIQKKPKESVFPDKDSTQTPEGGNQTYNVCDCCKRNDILNEKITHIESGHWLCPACLDAFDAASQNQTTAIENE